MVVTVSPEAVAAVVVQATEFAHPDPPKLIDEVVHTLTNGVITRSSSYPDAVAPEYVYSGFVNKPEDGLLIP